MKIGLIDSGKGGLAFLNGIYEGTNSYILIMDKAFFPYGVKSKEFLIKRTLHLCRFLFEVKKVDKVILACNTLSLIALPFVKIIYENKVSGVIELLPLNIPNGAVFIGSKNSIKNYQYSNAYDAQDLINKIERCLAPEEDIKDLCLNQLRDFELIILGCTHFIKVKEEFKKYKQVISQDDLYNGREELS